MKENNFFTSLRQELNETQNIRFKFTIQKLIFILKSISSLQKQYAVAFGEAFNTPDIIKIANADPTPDSTDPELFKIEKPKE